MNKTNIKRVVSLVGVLCLFSLTMAIYNEYSTQDFIGSVSFFKKYFKPHESSVHKLVHKHNHECSHSKIVEQEKLLDQPKQAFDESLYDMEDISKILPIEKEFNTIRITIDYSNISNQPQSIQNFLKTMIIPAMSNYFSELIKVQRLTAPIKVDPFYKNQQCGIGKVQIPTEHITIGVANTDLIFYIQAFRDSSSMLAYASYCPQSVGYGLASGRPTVAYMSINLNLLEKDINSQDPMALSKWIFVTMHETIHSLVFSPNYFDMFLNEKKPVQNIGGKPYVTARSIVQIAQEHFGCPSLSKVPLEDEGGPATYGTHWERKAFGNEIMTGSQLYDSVFSKFTAAMFNASGWYKINDFMTSTLTWGVNEQCDFVEYTCPKSKKEFCTGNEFGCSYDYTSPGQCSNTDFLADRCTYWQPSYQQHCTFPDEKTKSIYTSSGGAWGSKTRCFNTNIAQTAKQVNVNSLCLESRCDFSGTSTSVIFKVFDKEYTCNNSTIEVKIPGKGVVTCPDIIRFCFSPSSCPLSCSGKGICTLGKCSCYKGFTGEDCSKLK